MEPLELLAVTPELLGKAIIHRRERLLELIPSQLELSENDQLEAEKNSRTAKAARDEINLKVASLKKERNTAQSKAKQLFNQSSEMRQNLIDKGDLSPPEPKWAKEKLIAKLEQIENKLQTTSGNHKTEEKYINEMKALIREHEDWVEKRAESHPEYEEMQQSQRKAIRLIESAQKAHKAMMELAEANIVRHETYTQWEEKRRKHTSITARLKEAVKSSTEAKEFWEHLLDSKLEMLLSDAKRVAEGGPSTMALQRKKRLIKEEEE